MARVCQQLPGWRWVGEKLEPDMTVAGCRLRGMERVWGHCRSPPCRRSIELDLGLLEAKGYAKMDIREVEAWWSCALLTGCGLMWEHTSYPKGVPLAGYLGKGCTVTVTCEACGKGRTYSIEDLIAALERRRAGDGNTSVLRVAETIRGRCAGCGSQRWRTKLHWPPAVGGGSLFAKLPR